MVDLMVWPDWITTEGRDGYEYVRVDLNPLEVVELDWPVPAGVVGTQAWTRDLAEVAESLGESGYYKVDAAGVWERAARHDCPGELPVRRHAYEQAALASPCVECRAGAGEWCVTPGGNRRRYLHEARDVAGTRAARALNEEPSHAQ